MAIEEFLETAAVRNELKKLKKAVEKKRFSDVLDAQGHQYVDLVMEGGGVLGIALVGYTYCLEEVGIRFIGIGGASAGAINALLLAAMDVRQNAKSAKLIELLDRLDLDLFLDGDSDARDFSNTMLNNPGRFKVLFKAAQIIDNLDEHLGLHPGAKFLEWVTTVLKQAGVVTTRDLDQRMKAVPTGLCHREKGKRLAKAQIDARLALVAAEITTESKVEFPKMAKLFWSKPAEVSPACYLRASMSIPFFFHPYKVQNIPQGKNAYDAWESLTGYTGDLPKTAMFIDGGIMSNFPIDLFHVPNVVPSAPTFGVKLGFDRNVPRVIEGPVELAKAIFDSARHSLDYDFIKKNPDYSQLVSSIDTGSHNWLNFSLSYEEKLDLFVSGVREAARFLIAFNWEQYKETRKGIADAVNIVEAR